MKNKHLFEQFMKENGLEFNVPFTAEYEKISCDKDIYELEIRKVECCTGEEIEIIDVDDDCVVPVWIPLALLFDSSFKIVKKPWKPKKNEKYYFINAHNNIEYDWFDNTFVCDRYRYITGNFFKTYNEAEKHKDEVLKILKGEPLFKWEDK